MPPPSAFTALSLLYQSMDKAWDETATKYGFQCNGCSDNCCFSLFFHHTHVEKAFLIHGFREVSEEEQKIIREQARVYCAATFNLEGDPVSQKQPCPLLVDGKCRLYAFRPMICRLHGLPHELHKPGHLPLKSPGCTAGAFEDKPYVPFDRTPFYREMAVIEMEFRTRFKKNDRIRQTVAQMLMTPDA